MGNVIGSFFSGLGNGIASLFNTPLDFLSGKSCKSVCGATWDFICYIEHFCVTHLVKVAMVLILCYIALLFLYLLYKLSICSCVGRSLCTFYWACVASFFSACNYCCKFVLVKIFRRRRRRRRVVRDIEKYISSSQDEDESSASTARRLGSLSRPRRNNGGRGADRLRNSLRPRSHLIRVHGGRRSSVMVGTRTTNHARKGRPHKERRDRSTGN